MTVAVATATINPTVLNAIENTQKSVWVRGSVSIGASPLTYTTGGITMSFTAILEQIKSDLVPTYVRVWSQPAAASAAANQYVYTFLPGTTLANGVLQIFTGAAAQTALTELSAGAIPSGVSGDTIVFEGVFVRI